MAFSSANKYLGWIPNVFSDLVLRLFFHYVDLSGGTHTHTHTHTHMHAHTSIYSHTHRETERQTRGNIYARVIRESFQE